MKQKSTGAIASTAAWIFGIATSVLFGALWGRAVVIDTDELGESLSPLSESGEVANAFSEWMTTELVESGVPQGEAEDATQAALATTAVSAALEDLVVDVVDAAATDGAHGGSVDMAAALAPAVPALTESLQSSGIPVSEPQVAAVVADLDPLVIREPDEAAIVGGSSGLASRLGTAVLVAIVAQIVFGSLYVFAGTDRLQRMKTLLTRFALTGMSFAILLKLGSWVLDPNGGRAPISETLSLLADSKWVIPAMVGVAGAIAAVLVWMVRASVTPMPPKQVAGSRQRRGAPKPQEG
ncbi:MAG TPA: hypothetical protein VIW94_08355 [Acidimicrobiia bacterium]